MTLIRLLAVLCAFAGLSLAQLTRGYVSGTIQDPSGGTMSGVEISITNQATGIKTQATTNGSGVYRFVAVEPGSYNVEFAQIGFDTRRVSNILVTANQEVTLNQALRLAQAATTVDVIDAPPGVELNKSSATMERRLDAAIIQNIPLTAGTRDVNVAALLSPTTNRAQGAAEISANGQRARNNNFLLDGVDNNDLNATTIANRVIPEGVSELQTQIQAYSAEFGRNSGAQIQAITPNGTNALHGDVWDYYSGNWMEPVSLFNKRAGLTATPRYTSNQAGARVGGPVIKNKTFFWGLYEANIRREAPSANNAQAAVIPTEASFRALSSVALGQDQSAESRKRMLDGLGFLSSVYPMVGSFSSMKPVTVNGTVLQVGTINIPLALPADFHYYQARVDHNLSDSDRLSYRMMLDQRSQPDASGNRQFAGFFSAAAQTFGQNHSVSETHTFSPTLLSESRFAYVRRNLDFRENDPTTPTTAITGLFTIGGLSTFPQGRTQDVLQFQNVSTYLAGRHSLKFGFDVRYNKLDSVIGDNSKGSYTFDNFENYLNNRASTFKQALTTASFLATQVSQNYFFQDDFKITRNLTLNLGLRYETAGMPLGLFGATDANSLGAGVPGPALRDKNNWAPRGGISYSPSGTSGLSRALFGEGLTVFRGGYGIGYDVLFYNILSVNNINYPRITNNDIADRNALVGQWPNVLPKPAAGVTPVFDPRLGYVNSPADSQQPTVHFYNFSIQRQFSRNVVLEVAYTGSRSYHGVRQAQGNPGILTPEQAQTVRTTGNVSSIPGLPGVTGANPAASRRLVPAWGSRTLVETTGMANYNAFFVKLDKRLSHGLVIGGNYTYSANLSDSDEPLGVANIINSSPQVPQDYRNYRNEWGRSAFDVPARFSMFLTYQVPWFDSGILGSKGMKTVFGGWSVNGFTEAQSGQPFTIRTGVDTAGTGSAAAHRPAYNPNGQLTLDPVSADWRTFTTPIDGTGIVSTFLGTNKAPLANSQAFSGLTNNLGRNTFRGPGDVRTAASFQKQLDLTERFKAILRVDMINAFNHRNFTNPVATMSSPAFGQNTLRDPGGRTMLASLKIRF